ncbi:thiosulfate reductase, partial [bacterium]
MRGRARAIHAERELRAKHPLAIRWFHWINFPVITLMVWSGLMILWANNVFTVLGHRVITSDSLEHPLAPFDQLLTHTGRPVGEEPYTLGFRLAEGMWWHFAIAWLFAINGVVYVAYLLRSGAWRTIVPSRSAIREAIHVVLVDLHLSKRPLPDRKYNAAQQIAYTGVIGLGLLALLSGVAIYKPMQLSPLTRLLGGYT